MSDHARHAESSPREADRATGPADLTEAERDRAVLLMRGIAKLFAMPLGELRQVTAVLESYQGPVAVPPPPGSPPRGPETRGGGA